METYYFPCSSITPEIGVDEIKVDGTSIICRKLDTTSFDFYTLQARHKLHLPCELLILYYRMCNIEIRIEAEDRVKAIEKLRAVKFLLYIHGLSPFISFCISTHSINDISGINSRDSDLLYKKLPDELKDGINSETTQIEIWALELYLFIVQTKQKELTKHIFINALSDLDKWIQLKSSHKSLRSFESSLIASPMIGDVRQSILHLWSSLESLFPSVNNELSFKLSLFISQVISPFPFMNKVELFETVKKSYSDRCKIAHGNSGNIDDSNWQCAWFIACQTMSSILFRKNIPNEDELIKEFLTYSRDMLP